MKKKIVYQFKIELLGIKPLIWRQIEIPSNYNFWDFHIAIQDSMGWLDYHEHLFSITPPRKRKPTSIGIPHNDYENSILLCKNIAVSEYFNEVGQEATYDYDFGDSWHHKITFIGILLQKNGVKYPNCSDGKRACPPEDCGGIYGYQDLVKVLSDTNHEEYNNMIYWLSNHAKNYHPYSPNFFDTNKIKFWNPKKRWEIAFGK